MGIGDIEEVASAHWYFHSWWLPEWCI